MEQLQHVYEKFWETTGGRVIDCLTCGYKHVDPLPNRHQLMKMYEKNYFRTVKPFPYERVDDGHVEWRSKQVTSQLNYKEIYDKVIELLRDSGLALETRGMADIGCGNDLLSKYFIENNWIASVVEPNHDAATYLRKFGVPVFQQFADEEEEFPFTDFSFINLQFMLEHVIDPRWILEKSYRALAPGGIIRICVPNDFSVGQLSYQEYFKESYHWIKLPDHVNYFTFNDMSKLLSQCGFREVYRTTNFPLEFLLLGGINYYGQPEDQLKVGPFVANFEGAMNATGRDQLLRKLYDSLAQLEMGRSIYMYGVKE